jgi:hypothetical protein
VNPTIFAAGDRWEDHLSTLTPIEQGHRFLWKRDDAFAPPNAHGINGAKVRFLIWLVLQAKARGQNEIITGGSVLSPQIARSAVIGAHYSMPVTVVLGGTKPETAKRHPYVASAASAGATFDFVKVGYNPAIQKRISDLMASHPIAFRVPYGISVADDAPAQEMHQFHNLGAHQVTNIPETVETVVVPFGTGNSAASVLLGLHRIGLPQLKRVVLMGMGPNRAAWLYERLGCLERIEGPGLTRFAQTMIEHINLHDIGYTTYAKRVPWTIDAVEGHPTYEGKMMRYLDETRPDWWRDEPERTCVWIVGGERST